MKTHRMPCRQSDRHIFDAIVAGTKTVDTRAATVKNRRIEKGDVLIIKCGSDTVEKTVRDVRHFDTIESLLEAVPFQQISPDATSGDDIYKMYDSFPGYRQKIEQNGILAFYLS